METNEPKFNLRQGLTWSRLALGLQLAQDDLKFLMVLSPIYQMWDYRCVPRHTVNKNSSWLFMSPALFELFDFGTPNPSHFPAAFPEPGLSTALPLGVCSPSGRYFLFSLIPLPEAPWNSQCPSIPSLSLCLLF